MDWSLDRLERQTLTVSVPTSANWRDDELAPIRQYRLGSSVASEHLTTAPRKQRRGICSWVGRDHGDRDAHG